jgi:hypothetical protein
MSEPVRLQLPDGQVIWARVRLDDGPADVAWRDSPALARLDDLPDTVRAVATSVREALTTVKPRQVSVEFGIELAVKSGKVISVLTEAAAKASLRVTLTWGAGDAATSAADVADDDATPDAT